MTYNTYSQHGPYTNNAGPGIDQSFLNAVEAFLLAGWFDSQITSNGSGVMTSLGQVVNGALKVNPTPVTVTGTTAGNATLYQFLQGTLKAFFLFYNGYRNSTATEQTLTLPTAFTTYAIFHASGGIPPTHIYSGGSVLSSKFEVVTGLPVGSGAGATSTQSAANGFSYGDITSGFTGVGLGTSQGQTFVGGLLIIGI